ncbi:hypothetical protein ABW637_00095 [Aquimarina sp. 2304DJ70-9]
MRFYNVVSLLESILINEEEKTASGYPEAVFDFSLIALSLLD